MKKKLPFLVVLVTFLVFMISFISSAENVLIGPEAGERLAQADYEIIPVKDGYKSIKKYPEPEPVKRSAYSFSAAGAPLSRDDLGNFIMYSIPGEADSFYISVYFKQIYAENYYYYMGYYDYALYSEYKDGNNIVTLGEFDWGIAESYIIVIETDNACYKKEITQNDLGRIEKVDTDNTLVELELSMPFDTLDYFSLI